LDKIFEVDTIAYTLYLIAVESNKISNYLRNNCL